MARLIQGVVAKAKLAQFTRRVGMKVPEVTRIRPEAGRSSPEQGEVP